ncbi:MAG TPA: tRNA preQ1(34) S-adenosylmethionine ribosyltransferase-isomerase QueA [Longimicrobiaceae bacterium]|nr:tRNA preQ1(34) S-adenosylmethionine ribosyltransferase-isomerase QueA [Longimicrobiaceae bacterium]
MRTSDFDYHLPPDLIAQYPAQRREQSRLMVLDRATGEISHRVFSDLVDLIEPGDVLVVNETKVFPARLRGRRSGGGKAEVLLLHSTGEGDWVAMVRPGAKLKPGRQIEISPDLVVEILDVTAGGERIVRLHAAAPVDELLERLGEVPLPPYVARRPTPEDRERYQTVYARERGSVAAPTAGLHFTPELLARIRAKNVGLAKLTLHVGVGTFRPIETEDPAPHTMHYEWYRVTREAAEEINRARAAGGSVWAVGTTTVRTLESVATEEGSVQSGQGWTDIFIRPPYRFRAVDRLVTNFHLPRSTLLMLVSAFAGYDLVMRSYREAVAAGYRFYSYGDAMAIL